MGQRTDLLIEVDTFKTDDGQFIRVFNDYFPVAFMDENPDHVHVWLPMENTAMLRFVVNRGYARCSLWLDNRPANVRKSQITAVPDADGWREDVTGPDDLWSWMRQLGRLGVSR